MEEEWGQSYYLRIAGFGFLLYYVHNMPRKPRIEYPGAVYHVMNRGDRRRKIFRSHKDYEKFLERTEQVCERMNWRMHAFVLMPNHFHWLIETPEANLVSGMKWFLGVYSQHFNHRYGECGHVFQGRYKAVVIDPDSGNYYESVSSYIHLNPARSKLLSSTRQDLKDYTWSSFPHYLLAPKRRPSWLEVGRVLGNLGLSDNRRGRLAYEQFIDDRLVDIVTRSGRKVHEDIWKPIRSNWCLGGEDFQKQLLKRLGTCVHGKKRDSYSGEAIAAYERKEAEILVREGMKVLRLTERDLEKLPKGDFRKCVLAWLIHSQSPANNSWIARRLAMGSVSNMSTYVASARDTTDSKILKLKDKLQKVIRK